MGEPSTRRAPFDRREYYEGVRLRGRAYPGFDWPSTAVILNLLLAHAELQAHIALRLSRFGLSVTSFNILMILSRRDGDDCFLHELSDMLLVSRANVTGVVDTLVRKGLAERRAHEGDRRKCRVQITGEGKRRLKKLLPGHFREHRAITAGLTAPEKKQLSALLARLGEGFKERRETA